MQLYTSLTVPDCTLGALFARKNLSESGIALSSVNVELNITFKTYDRVVNSGKMHHIQTEFY